MSLAGVNSSEVMPVSDADMSQGTSHYARIYADKTMERIRQEVSNILAEEDDMDIDTELLNRDKTSCTSDELDLIRRERNRMHAKRTRLRKKKMLQEMEAVSQAIQFNHVCNVGVSDRRWTGV
jgi:hypothetical protein